MKTLYLLRGLPGSGKSTFGQLIGNVLHTESDKYFIDPVTGEYKFDASLLKRAHEWCQTQVERWMRDTGHAIAVSNTFTQEWEMEPYYKLAEKYGYTVFSIVVENRHGGKDLHNVPSETLDKMEKRFEIKLR